MAKEELLKEKYLQFQMIQQQIEQITQHVEALNQKNAELELSIEAIKELGKTKTNTEILSPIANGIFLKAELKDAKTLIINIGADTAVEKTIPEVIELLEQQQKEITENITEAENVFTLLQEQAMTIYKEVEEEQENVRQA